MGGRNIKINRVVKLDSKLSTIVDMLGLYLSYPDFGTVSRIQALLSNHCRHNFKCL